MSNYITTRHIRYYDSGTRYTITRVGNEPPTPDQIANRDRAEQRREQMAALPHNATMRSTVTFKGGRKLTKGQHVTVVEINDDDTVTVYRAEDGMACRIDANKVTITDAIIGID